MKRYFYQGIVEKSNMDRERGRGRGREREEKKEKERCRGERVRWRRAAAGSFGVVPVRVFAGN